MSTASDAPTTALSRSCDRRRARPITAFGALLLRDLAVLRKNLPEFVMRVVMQPVLFVFVFTYVFPKIGQGVGGRGRSEAEFASLLVPGVVAIACIFQGMQAVALPLVQEFGYTREIEDRVMAPLPVWARGGRRRSCPARCRACSRPPSCSRWPRSSRPRRCTSTCSWPVLLTVPRSPRARRRARARDRHAGAAPPGAADLQPGGHPDHVPGRDLLPVGAADPDPVAEGRRCC